MGSCVIFGIDKLHVALGISSSAFDTRTSDCIFGRSQHSERPRLDSELHHGHYFILEHGTRKRANDNGMNGHWDADSWIFVLDVRLV